ncbi:MAG: metal-dependent hydrolase [Sulfurovum sp.]|nr:MAG: metal-dependent hydrolase [Sulfurovum sp.]
MKIITADYIYSNGNYLQNHAIAFEEDIKEIDSYEALVAKYPDAKRIKSAPYTVIYPGFINPHVHLEFSANKTSLRYGSFMPWLDSVIANRDDLLQECDNVMMEREINQMLKSGITTFGAISSFGTELQVCEAAPQRVVFFNELIGSNAMYADMLYGDFLERLEASTQCDESSRIIPAIAIHAPYSVHPVILQKAISEARKRKIPLTTHFLESEAEREWLEKGEGEFKAFFEKYFNTSTPVTTIEEFMHAFDHYPALFTHAVWASREEFDHLAKKNHTIIHCPRSNRYLGVGRLPLEQLRELGLPYAVATDGLSSNDSLSLLDEMRAALMMHHQAPLHPFAQKLIDSVTKNAAKALRLNTGEIAVGKAADFTLLTLPDLPQSDEEIALWSILHTKEAHAVYIEGEQYV